MASFPNRLLFFAGIYLFQGLPGGYALTALTLHYAEKGISAEAIGDMAAIIGIPWIFKFLWGPFLDSLPANPIGRRRLPILLFSAGCVASLWALLSVQEPLRQITLVGQIFAVHALFASLLDVVVDALAIEVVPREEQGRVSAAMMVGRFLGTAVGSAGLAVVLTRQGYAASIGILALSCTLLLAVPLFFKEETQRSEGAATPVAVLGKTLKALTKPRGVRVALMVALVDTLVSLARRVLEYAFVAEHGWRAEQLSLLKGVTGGLLALTIVVAIGWLCDRVGPEKVTTGTIVITAGTYLVMSLLVSLWGSYLVGVSYNLLDLALRPAFQCAMTPLLMRVCDPEVEGSQYATYSGLFNLADVVGAKLFGVAHSHFSSGAIVGFCGLALAVISAIFRATRPVEKVAVHLENRVDLC